MVAVPEKRITASTTILKIQFILLSTVLSVVTFAGKNVLFMTFSVIGAIILLLVNKRFPLITHKSIFAILSLLILSFLINTGTSDRLSFAYSIFFVLSFIVFTSYFKAKIGATTFRDLAFLTLILYLIVLLIGQAYVLLGYFQGTYISKGLLHGPFGTLYEAGRGFRFYSLSSEPSYAAFIVVCLLHAILESDPDQRPFGKKNLYAWLVTTYMLFCFQSGYGVILFFGLILSKATARNVVIIGAVSVFIFLGALLTKQEAAGRVINIVTNLKLSRLEDLARIDHSASFRVLPTYYYVKNIDPGDPHFYFGYGAGESSEFLAPFLFDVEMPEYEGGFLPQFIYDYGILFGLAFFMFVARETVPKLVSFETFVLLMMITNANFNTQLFWFVITVFSLNKFYWRTQLYAAAESVSIPRSTASV